MPRRVAVAFVAVFALGTTLAACGTKGTELRPFDPKKTTSSTTPTSSTTKPESIGPVSTTSAQAAHFALTAPFTNGAAIDNHYTCLGDSALPGLSWGKPPIGTAELAIVITDSSNNDFINWVITGIPPSITGFPDDLPPAGSHQALNDTTKSGYLPACPRAGKTDTYTITLYALSGPSGVQDNATGHVAVGLIKAQAQAQATLTFTATTK